MTAERLAHARRAAAAAGVPLDTLECLALPVARAARLVAVTPRQLRRLLEADGVPLIDLGRGCLRVDVVDLVAFLDRRKQAAAHASPGDRLVPRRLAVDAEAALAALSEGAIPVRPHPEDPIR